MLRSTKAVAVVALLAAQPVVCEAEELTFPCLLILPRLGGRGQAAMRSIAAGER